jgi:hypothetical protein
MDTKAVQKTLQKAYQSMLAHIEELVDQDKKPLKEAFKEAEEKLSEWRELSREEVEHISTEIKSNLSDVGEASHQLNQSLKDNLSLDASYLADSIWNSLSKVADKTRIELSEFDKELREHMSTDAANQSEQQQRWFNEAMQWQGDYEKDIKQLDLLRALVRKNMRETTRFSKAVIKNTAEQTEHDLLAQKNQDLCQAVNKLSKSTFNH